MLGVFKSKLALARLTLGLSAGVLAVMVAGMAPAGALAATGTPSGERTHGQSTLEPVYDDTTGNIMYIQTPNHAHMNANPRAWAPFYLPVYPLSAATAVGTMLCAHVPADNCPDHGPEVAQGAAAIEPAVYGAADGSGVWGHDHLLAPPGSGGDFNIAWEPILVLFTSAAAANTHVTTLEQINALVSSGQAIEVPLPTLTFHCSVVPQVVYDDSISVTPV